MKIDSSVYELRTMKVGKVGKLQRALLAKAKSDPNYRFYSLWVSVKPTTSGGGDDTSDRVDEYDTNRRTQ